MRMKYDDSVIRISTRNRQREWEDHHRDLLNAFTAGDARSANNVDAFMLTELSFFKCNGCIDDLLMSDECRRGWFMKGSYEKSVWFGSDSTSLHSLQRI